MKFARIISGRIRSAGKTVRVAGDVNAVVAANVGESGQSTHVSSRQRVVHRSGPGQTSARDSTEKGADERTRAREGSDG